MYIYICIYVYVYIYIWYHPHRTFIPNRIKEVGFLGGVPYIYIYSIFKYMGIMGNYAGSGLKRCS